MLEHFVDYLPLESVYSIVDSDIVENFETYIQEDEDVLYLTCFLQGLEAVLRKEVETNPDEKIFFDGFCNP